MRIALRALAAFCILWAVIVPLLPTMPPPDSASSVTLWWSGATKEADEILGRSDEPIVIGATNTVPIRRSTLSLLTMRAKEPIRSYRKARFHLFASSVFAFLAGIGLFLLSRRHT